MIELIALTASLTSSLETPKDGVSIPFIVNLTFSRDALEDRKTASVIAYASTPVSVFVERDPRCQLLGRFLCYGFKCF